MSDTTSTTDTAAPVPVTAAPRRVLGRFRKKLGARAQSATRPSLSRERQLSEALEAHVAEIDQEIRVTGCDERHLKMLAICGPPANDFSYPSKFAQARIARLKALVECYDQQAAKSPDAANAPGADRRKILTSLAVHDIRQGQSPDVTEKALGRVAESTSGPGIYESEVLTEVQRFWQADAATAIEHLEVQALVRNLILAVLVFIYGRALIYKAMISVAGIDWSNLAMAIMSPFIGILGFFQELVFLSGFFGLIGAILSIWLDDRFSPRVPHWRLVRRSGRVTRCFGGFFIGFLVVSLAPFFLGATPNMEVASEEPGTAVTDVDEGSQEAAEDTAEEEAEDQAPVSSESPGSFRIYFLALTLGFSQDTFFKRIRIFGG